MVIEILFSEVCSLYGDGQNPVYLQATLPEAEFIFTALNETPYFADHTPDMIYIGGMSEAIQRRVIQKLMPYKERLKALIDGGIPFLATGNAWEVFTKHISYVTEKIEMDGLGIFDFTVKTDLDNRFNGKILGQFEGMTMMGFRSQFSFLYGDNSDCYFIKCIRGEGINPDTMLEGIRKNNFFGTQMLGPILPLNPDFCEYFIRLAGVEAKAAYREAAMAAFQQRLKEFQDPTTCFDVHY